MKAVIVAAGMGTRLHPLTENIPKCLVPVNDLPILDYQLNAIKKNGIDEVIIVVGHLGELIKSYTQEKFSDSFTFDYVVNDDFASSQNAYSLWLARKLLTSDPEGFIIFNSDLVLEPEMLGSLIKSPFKDAMIVDNPSSFTNDMVKVELDGDRIINMSKQMSDHLVAVEAVGPVKLSKKGGEAYFNFLTESFEKNGIKNWLFYTLGDFGKTYPFFAFKNPGYVWAEVDNIKDHSEAEEKFLTRRSI